MGRARSFRPQDSGQPMVLDGCMIFLHVPKAAGQTLNVVIGRQYERDEVYWYTNPIWSFDRIPSYLPRSIRVIAGPMPFGIHRDIPGPTTYITMLREPSERVLSLYDYIRENRAHPLHEEVARLSLEEFVTSNVDRYEVQNGQTRQISGVRQDPDRPALELAKSNLREFFSVIGLVEKFDESLMLLRKKFGWRMPFYVKKNVTSQRTARSTVPERVRAAIAERNELDIELFAFAHDLFSRTITDQGPLFAAQVGTFKLLNRLAQGYRKGRQILRSQ
jgi:hypothetical protein